MMQESLRQIKRTIGDLAIKSGLALVVVLIIAMDTIVLGRAITEQSVTEYAQALIILFCSLVFVAKARQQPQAKGFLILISGLFAAMFIRECDSHLDRFIHGFWVYPALLISASSILYARSQKGTFIKPMAEYSATRSYIYLSLGMVILLVFSRLFGTGHLWAQVMGDSYDIAFRAAIQEGLELLGYVLIAYGTALFHFDRVNLNQAKEKPC